MTNLVHDLDGEPGIIRFGRSVRIDPDLFLQTISHFRAKAVKNKKKRKIAGRRQ